MSSPAVEIFLPDEAATTALGARLGVLLRGGEAICLWGTLGAGKSTLARGLVRALTQPDEEVPSPTFTLVQTYDGQDFALAHFDLYRLSSASEVDELGLDEALDEGAALIEWPERLEGDLPPDRLDVVFETHGRQDGRLVRLVAHGRWEGRPLEF
jgi:tRNA threonylcarbamoyladenosine biosynthesis protein TsaE